MGLSFGLNGEEPSRCGAPGGATMRKDQIKKWPNRTSGIVGERGRVLPALRHCENAATAPTALKRTASVPW